MTFGCGYFPENEMLLYLEGKSQRSSIIEDHLRTCSDCLGEITELNLLNAKMESFIPAKIKHEPTLVVKIKDGSVVSAFSSSVSARLIPLAGTRSTGSKGFKALFASGVLNPEVSVQAVGGLCRISLNTPGYRHTVSEIRKKGEMLPLFAKNTLRSEIVFRGIKPGDYQIKSGEYLINISVRKA